MSITDFTYGAYRSLLELIYSKGYEFTGYYDDEYPLLRKCILRHDIDNSVAPALKISELEYEMGINSTFFVLLSTNFYNLFSKENLSMLNSILKHGHKIGLHFDETKYCDLNSQSFQDAVQEEAFILGKALGIKIKSVSMHRPSKQTLDADYSFDGITNSYSHKYFKEYKYLSDSRMCWQENAEDIIASGKYEKLHILTHAFWYANNKETIRYKLLKYIKSANSERYSILNNNIRELGELISPEEVKI